MPPRNVALVSLVLLAVALPGWACARLLLAREARALALGGALSVSAHAILGVLFPGALGWPLLAADLVSGIALLLVSRRAPRFRLEKLELFAFSASVLSVLVLTLIHRAPRGWDSTFHILLVERIAETGALPGTWEPWEPVAVHYTLGLHAIVAHVVRLTGLRPHEAFQGSFPLAYALLLGTFLCASKAATGSSLRAALGTLALGFLALQIRLIYHWGGLPTIVGIGVGLASALALLELPGRRGVAIAGFLLGSLPYLHHLSALVAWTVGLGLVSALRITGKTGDSSRVGAKRLALALGFAVLVALPTVPFALRAAGERGSTSIFHYTDEDAEPWLLYLPHWGLVLCALAVVGARTKRARTGIVAAFLVLLGVQVVLDHVWRALSLAWTGEAFAALTPTRWFDLASVPIAALAGAGATRIALGMRRPWIVAFAIVAVSVPSLKLLDVPPQGILWEFLAPSLDPDLEAASAWARERLPEDALVVVRARSSVRGIKEEERRLLPSRSWWPYLLERETDETPLPASEPRHDPRVLEKARMAADPAVARAVAERRGKKLFWLGPAYLEPVPGARRVGVFSGVVALDELER